MPRQKTRDSQFATIPVVGPAFLGLNTEISAIGGNLSPQWALALENAVFDVEGRIATRKGWSNQTTTAMTGTPAVSVLHEYLKNDDTRSIVAAAWTGTAIAIFESTNDGDSWSAITGSISSTKTNWSFVNFNGNVYATAPGQRVWEYTGTGTFTEIATSPVTSGVIHAAFGRLWVHEDASSDVSYCALLDASTWTGTGTGTLSLDNVWTQGTDTIQAIEAFGSSLVVFARKHIILYVDGSGSVLGIDPDNMYVVDTIEGTGTQHKYSVVRIGEGDLWFLGELGFQSLARVISEKVNPLVDISKNVRTLVNYHIDQAVGAEIAVQGIYDPKNQMVLYIFPDSDEILMFDTKQRLEDGSYRAAQWTGFTTHNALLRRTNGDILYGMAAGTVSKYDTYRDGGSIFDMVYGSPWLDGGPELHNRLKIVKQFYAVFYGQETLTATARWAYDFRPLEYSETFTNDYTASGGEWGTAKFNSSEFAAGYRLRRQYIGGMGDGQYVQLWVTVQSTDVDAFVGIQEMGMHMEIGRAV